MRVLPSHPSPPTQAQTPRSLTAHIVHIEFLSALLIIHSRLDHFSRIWEGKKLVSSGRQSPDTEKLFPVSHGS